MIPYPPKHVGSFANPDKADEMRPEKKHCPLIVSIWLRKDADDVQDTHNGMESPTCSFIEYISSCRNVGNDKPNLNRCRQDSQANKSSGHFFDRRILSFGTLLRVTLLLAYASCGVLLITLDLTADVETLPDAGDEQRNSTGDHDGKVKQLLSIIVKVAPDTVVAEEEEAAASRDGEANHLHNLFDCEVHRHNLLDFKDVSVEVLGRNDAREQQDNRGHTNLEPKSGLAV
mmetsp:Transcript_13200/g.27082  ORF Transcript_13200/g.27082 Transcript_13200/m.27082 type:complete len:230 (-) Transcript_13200:251-940(-)